MLQEYGEKRDFRRTREPAPAASAPDQEPLVFVVQKHSARRLHYDFRLELDGVLKSWALPRGPSSDPKVKRLAVMVEDHPLDYASFEGNIPKGEYGAGEVIVWDKGDYSPDEDNRLLFDNRSQAQERVRQGLAQGKLSIFLRGHKLKGSWTLVRMKRGENDWLLIKHPDDFAGPEHDALEEGASVLSGLTIEDLKAGKQPAPTASAGVSLSDIPGARKAVIPSALSPMLASSAASPFSDPDWLFEPKLDGYRIVAMADRGSMRLLSRNGVDVTQKYPGVLESLRNQPAAELVLDGEIIALDRKGKLCFQCLQGYLESLGRPDTQGEEAAAIIYYVFDILFLDGYDLSQVPLAQRKGMLGRVLRPSKQVRLLEHFEGDGEAIFRGAVAQGLEGIIAKRKDSIYQAGRRLSGWLKIKATRSDDFVVGGYTRGTGSRTRTFGSLLLGYYNDGGQLVPAGHVGTGFDERALTDLRKRLDAMATEDSPFAEMPELNAPTTWVRPEIVVEVAFTQWTRDGRLRAPVFLRLRDDKSPAQVHLSPVISAPASVPPRKGSPSAGLEDAVAETLEQLGGPRHTLVIEVQGQRIELSNLDKELWPPLGDRRGLTKRDLLTYLARVSPYLLEHLRDRPLTLSRYPNGIYGEHFYQKHWSGPLPPFVDTVRLSERRGKEQEYILCNNLPTLLWLGQVADLELHTWFSRVSPGPDRELPAGVSVSEAADFLAGYPDFIIFDLDPYIYSGTEPQGGEPELNRQGFARACEAALWVKETLDSLSLPSFVKTSGRTGLHIHAPILRQFDYHATHAAARTICEFVLQHHPKAVTTEWAVEKRRGRVFLDYNQNVRGKTLASVYSPRPSPEATVSVPLRWDELGRAYPTDFTLLSVPGRLAELGDLWGKINDAKGDLKQVLGHSWMARNPGRAGGGR